MKRCLLLLLLLFSRVAPGPSRSRAGGAVCAAICGALPRLTRVGRRADRCGIAVESASTVEQGSDGIDAAHAGDSASFRRLSNPST